MAKMHEHEARLERLLAEKQEAPKTSRKLRLPGHGLVGGGPVRSGEIVVRAEGLAVGYLPVAGSSCARAPFLAARRGDRIGIVGPNGAGKTTLLRTIAGELPPLDGAISFGHGVQLGYLAQLRAAGIPGATVLDALLESVPVTPGEARGYLARFLFRGDDVLKEVRLLSGGERSRLELALLGVMPSNVYLLDEPTNHLDVVAREAIEAFLLETPATMLVVSHDRRFLDTVCERLWVVDDGAVAPFDGGYKAWRAAVSAGWTVASALEQEAKRLLPGTGAARRSRDGDGGAASRSPPADRTAWRPPPPGSPRAGAAGAPGASRPEAVEGRLPPTARAGRLGADAPRAAQEPPRARAVEARGPIELHRAAPRLERARGRRSRPRRHRGRVARARGARAVTGRFERGGSATRRVRFGSA